MVSARRLGVVFRSCGITATLLLVTCSAATAEPAAAELDETLPVLVSVERPSALFAIEPPLTRQTWSAATLTAAHERRPRLLNSMYAGFVVLQVLDAHSTIGAVSGGSRERNPIMAPFADEPVVMIGVKAAATIGTIALAEKLWRRHPVAAVALMVAANAGYAFVVAQNYRQTRR